MGNDEEQRKREFFERKQREEEQRQSEPRAEYSRQFTKINKPPKQYLGFRIIISIIALAALIISIYNTFSVYNINQSVKSLQQTDEKITARVDQLSTLQENNKNSIENIKERINKVIDYIK